MFFYFLIRLEILQKKQAKQTRDMELLAEREKKKQDEDEQKRQEDFFLEAERKACAKEHNDQIKTKRLIDNMMTARPERLQNETCELLANYRGCIIENKFFFVSFIFNSFSLKKDILET